MERDTFIENLEKERDEARYIVKEIWWMARRYADGRNTFAPHMFNEAMKKAEGWIMDTDNGEIWAKDPIDQDKSSLQASSF